MKLKNLLIVAVLSAVAFTSCKDNTREVDDDINIEADREAEMRANQERLDRENNVTARIGENDNLSTFSENMNRNQISQNFGRGQAATTGQGQTGTTSGQDQNQRDAIGQQEQGRTTGQTGTTGQGQVSGQGQMGQMSYTIFAPSNDAYNNLTEAQRTEMMDTANMDRNTASINYLMVQERLTEDQLRQQIKNSNGSYTITTMQGEDITASLEGDEIVLRDGAGNQARITETDSEASDGIVYTIDSVLMPQDPSQNAAANRAGNDTGTNNTGTNTSGTNNTGTGTTNTGTNNQ